MTASETFGLGQAASTTFLKDGKAENAHKDGVILNKFNMEA